MGKVVLIDNGVFMFRAIHAWRAGNKAIPIGYTYLNMILSNLKRIGIDKEDRIILAIDQGHSWRKQFDSDYKANRKIARDALAEEIDWKSVFNNFELTYLKLNESTDWHIIRINTIEADDIIATACRFYKDKDIVVVSSDADLQQLTAFKNVKIFSPLVKIKGGKGGYKIVKNPYKIIAEKVAKGDVADNIIIRESDTKEDVEIRELIINLLELPEFVEQPIIEKLKSLPEQKDLNIDKFPFRNLADRYFQIYEKDKVITYEDCIEKVEKKKKSKKKTVKKTVRRKKNDESSHRNHESCQEQESN